MAPECTIRSSSLALASGMGFECDLQVLRSGQVIVLHDSTLYRTTAPGMAWISWLQSLIYGENLLQRKVGDLDIDEVRDIKVGDHSHTESVPLFVDFLQLLRTPPKLSADTPSGGCGDGTCEPPSARFVHMFAELKSNGYEPSSSYNSLLTEGCAAAVLEEAITPAQLTWISFSLKALVDMKRRTPEHAALLVQWVTTSEQAWEVARLAVESGLDGIDLNADPSVVRSELVEWLHAREKVVAVYVSAAPASNDVETVWEHMSAGA